MYKIYQKLAKNTLAHTVARLLPNMNTYKGIFKGFTIRAVLSDFF